MLLLFVFVVPPPIQECLTCRKQVLCSHLGFGSPFPVFLKVFLSRKKKSGLGFCFAIAKNCFLFQNRTSDSPTDPRTLGARPPCPQEKLKIMQLSGNCKRKPLYILSKFWAQGPPPPWGQNSTGPPDQNPGSAPVTPRVSSSS